MNDTETLTEQEIAADLPEDPGTDQVYAEPAAAAEAMPKPATCDNCAEPLLGPHCYACGQPAKSLLRQFPELVADFFGTVFGLDSRIARTFGPLLLKPGFLSQEYFAGRRVRYVSPVRLFIFLCLTAFFAAQLSSDWRMGSTDSGENTPAVEEGVNLDQLEQDIARATSVDDVLQFRDQALDELRQASRESEELPALQGVLAGVEQVVQARSRQRIAEIDPAAVAELETQPAGKTFKPLQFEGAPEAVNKWLEQQSGKFESNLPRIERDPNLLKDAIFSSIPSTLFILLPVFALMLSLLYLFKRRLYMEHLIVALHSHAFLSLALLLVVVLVDLRGWLATPDSALDMLFGLILTALAVWMPIYLLLMQKRIYRQGWFVTSAKFALLGGAYITLLGGATAFTALASMVNL
ncbi:DUF3667 domain-containing protein [uncultured Microbulbifer sp.]|uniref:DUF3667 domain-containing protein n=1 Tax=uncultured Microbulbifer sp. TaxID=348147 RepID=UPI0025CC8202|nr:DUF3667 domain-containing protein [uncultured Microbulbifer sp.]